MNQHYLWWVEYKPKDGDQPWMRDRNVSGVPRTFVDEAEARGRFEELVSSERQDRANRADPPPTYWAIVGGDTTYRLCRVPVEVVVTAE